MVRRNTSDASEPPSPAAVTLALQDLRRALDAMDIHWALIGGQALRAYGVPRHTLDLDAMVPASDLLAIAEKLVDDFDWTPLKADRYGNYKIAKRPEEHTMDDKVLFVVRQQRRLIPLRNPLGLTVEILAAQHPVEKRMIESAAMRKLEDTVIPVAPLGGVLLVKAKADRAKDHAAIEQTAEHVDASVLAAAIAWALKTRDPDVDDLRQSLALVQARLPRPVKRTSRPRKRRSR